MGLGSASIVSLGEARHLAAQCRQLRAEGVDPIEAKRAKKTKIALDTIRNITFAEAAESYFKAHSAGWRSPKHTFQWKASLETYVFPVIGALPIHFVDTAAIIKISEPFWSAKPETASRVRGRIEAVIAWAKARGFYAGDNPATWRNHLDKLLPSVSSLQKKNPVKRHVALPDADLPAFLTELRQYEDRTALALEFAILTAARSKEVLGAAWDEIDFDNHIWTVPAERMKTAKKHRVPLSARAIEILEGLPRNGTLIFSGLSDKELLRQMRRMDAGDATPHGFRSSFMDWAHETTAFPKAVIDMALAHSIGDKTEAAYRRGILLAKRARLMDEWGKFCSTPAATGDDVISLRRSVRNRHGSAAQKNTKAARR
jgi:integrase